MIERKCSKCKIPKPINQFGMDKYRKYGRSYVCKPCAYKNLKSYKEKYPEKRQETMRSWYQRTISARREAHRLWIKNNPREALSKLIPGYSSFHRRVREQRGIPSECDICGSNDLRKAYDWANLTGQYDDIYDYKRMCRSCHQKHDRRAA